MCFCICVHPHVFIPGIFVFYVGNCCVWENLRSGFLFFFFFFFLCLRVGLRSKASVCQYLVIVCASIFIFHSLWSLSPCVWPNYITWPCPLRITPTPCAARNVEAEVTGDVPPGDQERFSRWIRGASLLSVFSHFCICFSAQCIFCKRDAFHAHFRTLARADVLWLLCLV